MLIRPPPWGEPGIEGPDVEMKCTGPEAGGGTRLACEDWKRAAVAGRLGGKERTCAEGEAGSAGSGESAVRCGVHPTVLSWTGTWSNGYS